MRRSLIASLLPVLLLVTVIALPGCCSVFCRAPAPVGASTLTRDTPDEALDYVVDAFRNRRIRDIYASVHPDFWAANGELSLGEFTTAFREFEHIFQSDANRFARAKRDPAAYGRNESGVFAGIELRDGDMSVRLIFKNRPIARVKLDDDFVPESQALIPELPTMLQVEDGWVMPIEPIEFNGLAGADPLSVLRLEYHHDWLLYDVQNARNVGFINRIREELGQ